MSNPVNELFAIMDRWRDTPGSAAIKRRVDLRLIADWSEVRDAMNAIVRIERFLDFEGKLEENKALVDALWRTVIQPEIRWRRKPRIHLDAGQEVALRFIGTLYDRNAPHDAAPMSRAEVDEFKAELEEARAVVVDFTHLVGDNARVVLRAIDALLDELDKPDPDFERARSLSHQMLGACIAVVWVAPERARVPIRDFMERTASRWYGLATSMAAESMSGSSNMEWLIATD